jgi:sugar phosphate isomerase/epimerase
MNRREFLSRSAYVSCAMVASHQLMVAAADSFILNYMVGSSMFGELPLSDILPSVVKTGSNAIDIWPRAHGNQREQMEAMGHEAFAAVLKQHKVQLGCLTHYDLGPHGLSEEMSVAKKFGCPLMVAGGKGPKGLKGADLKAAVRVFADSMEPHLRVAERHGVTIAIENHGNNVIDSPDSLKWLRDLRPSKNLKIALAPYHLENLGVDAEGLADLISVLGNDIAIFYAWQHGMGCIKKLPKAQELLQMPGRGDLDFTPALQALKRVSYSGFTEIFMHPVPRGIPILPTAQETTDEINRSREYLERCLSRG